MGRQTCIASGLQYVAREPPHAVRATSQIAQGRRHKNLLTDQLPQALEQNPPSCLQRYLRTWTETLEGMLAGAQDWADLGAAFTKLLLTCFKQRGKHQPGSGTQTLVHRRGQNRRTHNIHATTVTASADDKLGHKPQTHKIRPHSTGPTSCQASYYECQEHT